MNNSKKHQHDEKRAYEEKTKEILAISPKERDKKPSVKRSYENDADWLSSISTDHQIRRNGANGSKIKKIFLAVIQ